MKVVLQRVKNASVEIENKTFSKIGAGYLLFIGFESGDGSFLLKPLFEKITQIKLFPDEQGRFKYSIEETSGSILIVSQFTLSADLKKGKKPSFTKAMEPVGAESLYNKFVDIARLTDIPIESGVFQAMMQVQLQNDGPVTILLDTRLLFPALHSQHNI